MTYPAKGIQCATQALHQGGLIAYPTEAMYGLGCDPNNKDALQRLLNLKGRDVSKGLILVCANIDQVAGFIQPLSQAQRTQIGDRERAPTTWLIPAKTSTSQLLVGSHSTLAVRLCYHPVVQALCLAFAGPIVSTSANRAGQAPLRTAPAVNAQFGDTIDVIVAGDVGPYQTPSTIVDLCSGRVVRAASIRTVNHV